MRKFLNKVFNLKSIATGSRRVIGTVSLLIGLVGVAVVLFNPMPLFASLFPLHYENILWNK